MAHLLSCSKGKSENIWHFHLFNKFSFYKGILICWLQQTSVNKKSAFKHGLHISLNGSQSAAKM